MARLAYEVFLSSRFEELETLRAAVVSRLEGLERPSVKVVDVARFGADALSAVDNETERVRSSDVLLLLVGNSYGPLIAGGRISHVEHEYRVASSKGSRSYILPYFIGEVQPPGPIWESSNEQLRAFKKRLCDRHRVGRLFGLRLEEMVLRVVEDVQRVLNLQTQFSIAQETETGEELDFASDLSDLAGVLRMSQSELDREDARRSGNPRARKYDALTPAEVPLAELYRSQHRLQAQGLYEEARLALGVGERGIATQLLRKAVEAHPLDFRANFLLSKVLFVRGSLPEVAEAERRALRCARMAESDERPIYVCASLVLAARAAWLLQQASELDERLKAARPPSTLRSLEYIESAKRGELGKYRDSGDSREGGDHQEGEARAENRRATPPKDIGIAAPWLEQAAELALLGEARWEEAVTAAGKAFWIQPRSFARLRPDLGERQYHRLRDAVISSYSPAFEQLAQLQRGLALQFPDDTPAELALSTAQSGEQGMQEARRQSEAHVPALRSIGTKLLAEVTALEALQRESLPASEALQALKLPRALERPGRVHWKVSVGQRVEAGALIAEVTMGAQHLEVVAPANGALLRSASTTGLLTAGQQILGVFGATGAELRTLSALDARVQELRLSLDHSKEKLSVLTTELEQIEVIERATADVYAHTRKLAWVRGGLTLLGTLGLTSALLLIWGADSIWIRRIISLVVFVCGAAICLWVGRVGSAQGRWAHERRRRAERLHQQQAMLKSHSDLLTRLGAAQAEAEQLRRERAQLIADLYAARRASLREACSSLASAITAYERYLKRVPGPMRTPTVPTGTARSGELVFIWRSSDGRTGGGDVETASSNELFDERFASLSLLEPRAEQAVVAIVTDRNTRGMTCSRSRAWFPAT